MRHRMLAVAAIVPFLAACATSTGAVQSAGAGAPRRPGAQTVRQPSRYHPRPPQVLALPGLEGVIGSTTTQLGRQFGPARLDVWEGDARKLQFVGPACVLDVYLYPPEQGHEPQATYLEARRSTDGQDVDRLACVTALRK